MVLIRQRFKFMFRYQIEYLIEDRITMSYGLIPLCYKVFLSNNMVTTGLSQAILIPELTGH